VATARSLGGQSAYVLSALTSVPVPGDTREEAIPREAA